MHEVTSLGAGISKRTRGALLVVATVAVALLGAACGPLPDATVPDPYKLHTSVTAEGFTLSWKAPSGYNGDTYEIQWYKVDTPWASLPDTIEGTSTTFAAPLGEGRYTFRVRSLPATNPNSGGWSPARNAVFVVPELPVVRIDTQDRAPILDRDNYVSSTISIDPNGSDFDAYTGTAGIRGRGNSTWSYSKKPYRIKLDTKSPIMGLASERDWALLANAVDESQLRNYAATEMSRFTSLPYAPTMRHVEVILNGDYVGVYTLTQHNEIGKDRVDIVEMDEDDVEGEALTGGYRLEIDARMVENNEPGFHTGKGIPVVIKDPDPALPVQRNYIRSFVQNFEDALFQSNYADPVNGYRKHLHMDSFIDYFIIQEVTYNQDAYWSSTFMTKERGDDKLRFGPVWDFDNAIGNNRGNISSSPIGDWARGKGPWNKRIFTDPTIDAEIGARWQELRPAFSQLPVMVLDKAAEIADGVQNDHIRWHPPGVRPDDDPMYIANWLNDRMAWMDSRYPAPEG